MKVIGLSKVLNSNAKTFTTNTGIKIRKFISPVFRQVLKLAIKRKVIIENFPKLNDNETYIFASTHSFDEDIIAGLAYLDRNAYVLMGTTDQIKNNPQSYAAWINGMIYVNRLDPESRKESLNKMERILKNGTSILMFPEGGWNNTENLLIQPLFAGPYILSQRTKAKVVPIATFNEHNSKKIYMSFGQPLDLYGKSKKEALIELRDSMATMMFESIEKHTDQLNRDSLYGDIREKFMEQRKNEYMRVNWTEDVWHEELAFYHDKNNPRPQKIRETLSEVEVTPSNAKIITPILNKISEDKKYDFEEYMHRNWKR